MLLEFVYFLSFKPFLSSYTLSQTYSVTTVWKQVCLPLYFLFYITKIGSISLLTKSHLQHLSQAYDALKMFDRLDCAAPGPTVYGQYLPHKTGHWLLCWCSAPSVQLSRESRWCWEHSWECESSSTWGPGTPRDCGSPGQPLLWWPGLRACPAAGPVSCSPTWTAETTRENSF